MSIALLLAVTAGAADITLEPGNDVAALTSSLTPGDTITFNAGTYILESALQWNAVGDEANPIRFIGNGEVILESAIDGGGTLIRIFDSSYVELENLTLRGSQERFDAEQNYDGLRINNSSFVTIKNVTIENIGENGIEISGGDMEGISITDTTVQFVRNDAIVAGCFDASCSLTRSEIRHNVVHDTVNGDGIELSNGCNENIIADNVIFNVADQGIQTRSTEFGEPNMILGNAVWQSMHGIFVSGAAQVQNNVIFNLEGEGIVSEDERDTLENVRITFNTVYNTGDWGVRLEDWRDRDSSNTLVFANNAITNTTGAALVARPAQVDVTVNLFANNVITGFIEADEMSELDGHFRPGAGAADYTDPVGWDFYPTLTSSLVNTGSTDGATYIPTTDFLGNPREGDQPDVGAYERCLIGDGNPGWQIREDFKGLEGNECNNSFDDSAGGGCCGNGDVDEGDTALLLAPLLLVALRRRRRHTA